MAKIKIFYSGIAEPERIEHDNQVQDFLLMLETHSHTFINLNTIVIPEGTKNYNIIRTEITYIENCKRTVITEKKND